MNAIISAAGLGSRLGLNIPKCLVKINNKTIIQHQLELLKEFENVYVVVGFKEELVISEIFKHRSNAIIVRNPDYASTSNAYSLHLASKYINDGFLAIDGDIIFDVESFSKIVNHIKNDKTKSFICATTRNTDDSVNIIYENDKVIDFSRTVMTDLEWTGCGYFYDIQIPSTAKFVFNVLSSKLPLPYINITCWEIDTQDDLNRLLNNI